MICPEELVALVSTLSIAIAKDLTINQLDILAAVLTQLADTLATISVQRSIIEECCDKLKNEESGDENQTIDEEIVI